MLRVNLSIGDCFGSVRENIITFIVGTVCEQLFVLENGRGDTLGVHGVGYGCDVEHPMWGGVHHPPTKLQLFTEHITGDPIQNLICTTTVV